MTNIKNNKILLAVVLLAIVGTISMYAKRDDVGGTGRWKMFYDREAGITFKYPKKLSTEYIRGFDWPPKVGMLDLPFTCVEAGKETERAGKTSLKTIEGKEYCVTKLTEGAAGSTYTQYAYATDMQGKTIYFTFSLRSLQCGNYDEPQKAVCEMERASFNIDSIIHKIAQTFSFL